MERSKFPDKKYLFPDGTKGPFLARLVSINGLYRDVVVNNYQHTFETISSLDAPSYFYNNEVGQAPAAENLYRRCYKAEVFHFRRQFPVNELHMSSEEIHSFVWKLEQEYPYGRITSDERHHRPGKVLTVLANAIEYREVSPQPQYNVYIYDGVWQAIKRAAKAYFNRMKVNWNNYKTQAYARNDFR